MKTLFATFAIAISVLSTSAAHFSALNLKLFDNGVFSVSLDNHPSGQLNYFSIPKLKPGYHKLHVVRYIPSPYYGYPPIKQVVYSGWISVPARSVMYAQINCYNQFEVVKVEPYFHPPSGNCGNYGYENTGYYDNGWGPASPASLVPGCMNHYDFIQLKSSIASKSFESSKMQVAKQAFAYNNFTAAQVAELMTLFSFESSRLDIAKSAYPKVIDKQNYYMVNNAFDFESSINELNVFLAGK